ncbi:MAG TPA: hypothetical protein VJ476_07095, partial [Rhizomicrobium sp.]|nr:hypothetical protein [Rhizomicrobium sp.]
FVVLLGFTAAASAQDQPAATGAPKPLGGPSATAPAPGAPPPDQPPAADSNPVEFKPGMVATKPAVTAGELGGLVDGPPVGALDDAHGGLGQSMWVNSPREAIEDLLGRIPLVSADPFVRGLSLRVLLTPSDAPAGSAKRALVTIRIEKLLQGGLVDDAGTLAAALKLDNDPDFARVQADALLYAGRDKEICGDLTATRLTSPDPFWLELRDFCFASGGDSASAELTRAALDGLGVKDPAFDILVADVLTGAKKSVPAIDHPTALHVFLIRKAGLVVSNALAAKLGTAANAFAARDPRNSTADRLAAASRIAATGALSNIELLAILNAQTIAPKDLALAQAVAGKLLFLPAQGLLRRAALLEARPPAKTDLVLAALSAGGNPARLPQAAALQGDVALPIKPSPIVAKGRPLIPRALVLVGKVDAASAWYAGAAEGEDLEAFRILVDLAAPNASRDAAAQTAYAWFAVNAAPQKNPDAQAALALGLADVLGGPMPPVARSLAANLEGMRWQSTAPRPNSADIRSLEEAASQPGRKGEVVLRVLDIVGPNGPHDLPADVVIECVRVLVQAGLPNEARALAVEALAMP